MGWHALSAQIGESDCEIVGAGAIAQPANTWSSLAYLAVGLVIVARARRFDARLQAPAVAYGVTLAAVGFGSVAFHGPMPSWAQYVHDLANIAALLFIIVFDIAAVLHGRPAPTVAIFAATTAGFGIVLARAPESSVALTWVVALIALVAEVVAVRRTGRMADRPRRRVGLYVSLGVLVVVAATLNAFGRTGGPLCDPDSVAQLHAVWHVMTAGAFGLWADLAFSPRVVDHP